MEIRTATLTDLDELRRVYRAAKVYMDATGNATQWQQGYPANEILMEDIRQKKLYVLTEEEQIHAVFYFSVGEDPTYRMIENGAWQNDLPYGVIHRVASDGKLRGVMRTCVGFCKKQISNLRIDTHENNLTMQNALQKLGFVRCGIIYLESGDARIAYHLAEKEEQP